MKKSILYSAIATCLCIPVTQAYAAHGSSVAINNMKFSGINYVAEGTLSDNVNDFGLMQSVDNFFDFPWAAAATAYFEPGMPPTFDNDLATDEGNITNGTVPLIFDDPLVNGPFTQTGTDDGSDGAGGTMYTWSGSADKAPVGAPDTPFTYNFTLQPNEIAWGTLFNWSTNGGIPVLVIVDCISNPGVCKGRGTPMVTSPFPGNSPAFSGGPPPLSCPGLFKAIKPNTPLTITYTELTTGCTGGVGTVNFVSSDGTSANGGAIADNGASLSYAPMTDFQGADSFNFELADDIFTVNPTYDVQVGGELQGNFTIMKGDGGTFGGANDVIFTWDQVSFNVDESDPIDANNALITITSKTLFFASPWTAHHIRVYDGGVTGKTLVFDTTCSVAQLEAGTADCGGSPERMMALPIPAGMYGAHILFDWNGNYNIDVVNVWQPNGKWDDADGPDVGANNMWVGPKGVPPDPVLSTWQLASKDVNGDGINGAPMLKVDSPFPGNYANFSWKPDTVGKGAVPIDTQISAVNVPGFSLNLWAMFAGLATLIGLRKYKANK